MKMDKNQLIALMVTLLVALQLLAGA